MAHPTVNIDSVSLEGLNLIEKFWDSLTPSETPVTEAQKRQLDRRLDNLDRDFAKGQPLGVPWDEVEQLRGR